MQKITPLVLIHGLKGATLADPSGKTYWITSTQALGLSTPNLALPLQWDTSATQQKDTLTPREVLKKITIFPYLLEKQIYGKWLETAQKSDRPFYPFTYDWRRDNMETLALFDVFLQKIYAQHGKVQVVAHSMGGLITLAALNQHPELFHSVVFAGVPFGGGISFLPDLTRGEPTGLNRKILSPEVLGSFPSIYSLFPLESTGLLMDENGQMLDVDFFRASDWLRYHWGLFSHSEINKEAKMKFMEITLQRAKAFRQLLVAKPVKYPPISVVYGDSIPTVAQGKRKTQIPFQEWNFSELAPCKGDGRVCAKLSVPPSGISFKSYPSNCEHAALLDDPGLIQLIKHTTQFD